MPPPDGRTFRLNNATVVEPEGLKPLLEPILNDLIAAGKLTLWQGNRPSSWLIQATRKGDHYGNSEQFPSYRVNHTQFSAVPHIALLCGRPTPMMPIA